LKGQIASVSRSAVAGDRSLGRLHMNILPIIKAPLAVQVYRCFFAACLVYFGSFIRLLHHDCPPSGILVLTGFPSCSLVGMLATCIRVSLSRWILAILGFLIPGVVFGALLFWSYHAGWWDWLFGALFGLLLLGLPACGAFALFRDAKTSRYFINLTD
jgi:hypothetical protein